MSADVTPVNGVSSHSISQIPSSSGTMSSSVIDWVPTCEEVATSSAIEVASILRAQFPLLGRKCGKPSGSYTDDYVSASPLNATSDYVSPSVVTAALNSNTSPEAAEPTHTIFPTNDLIGRFIEVFKKHLEDEILLPSSEQNNGLHPSSTSSSTNSNIPNPVNGHSNHFHDDNHDYLNADETILGIINQRRQRDLDAATTAQASRKPFYRRLSFKGFRKGRFFKQQSSEEQPVNGMTSASSSAKCKSDKNKAKFAKIVVECEKEGIVNYLSGENMDGTQKWAKCRLALVKTVGGYMLEFYSPPKAVKPKSGVFCFLIREARETTALEMPDRENTFVLKADNSLEYVIEAPSVNDMKSWLSIIKYSMRDPNDSIERQQSSNSQTGTLRSTTGVPNAENSILTTPGADSADESQVTSPTSMAPASTSGLNNPPQLPPRVVPINSPGSPPELVHGGLNGNPILELRNNPVIPIPPSLVAQGDPLPVRDIYSALQEYPWFHGTLSRSEAARLVLQEQHEGHGTFLVRQSETRVGEFVLTFNFQGKAKHLRMTLSPEGQCRVQHLWFQSVFDMLEHFRHQPIPLESGGTSDVTLTEFVVALPSLRGLTQLNSRNSDRSRQPLLPEAQMVVTHSGSVRLRSESMERIQREQSSGGNSRAVENTYSFV